ncbi:MAG: GTP 3',8-cyclase MoaA [Planctomycetota bacterium]
MTHTPPTPPTPSSPELPSAAHLAATTTAGSADPGRLVDKFGRVMNYLRLAVNETCNLRCTYCMPAEGLPFRTGPEILQADEIIRVVRVCASLGVQKVRYTGGEPTLRRELIDLVRAAAQTPGIRSVHLTTNGLLLEKQARALREAGCTGLNISLDTLDADRFLKITRRAALPQVLGGLRAALAEGFPSIKLNVVALRGFNDDEIGAFAAMTRDEPIGVRFIELMPFDSKQIWKTGKFLSAERICKALAEAYPGLEPASGTSTEHHCFRIPGHRGTVSVIPAYTRSLCGACNRLRITADGKLRNCLYAHEEFDLLAPLREGASDDVLRERLQAAVGAKPRDGREAQALGSARAQGTAADRGSMTMIGG